MADLVVDASAVVDLLLGNPLGTAVARRLRGHDLHAPAHLDAEVLSALGRLHRADEVDGRTVAGLLAGLRAAPVQRHPLAPVLEGAWARRYRVRLVDAVYLQLAAQRGCPLVTTDRRLRAEERVDVIG